jgi:hypothetical protein
MTFKPTHAGIVFNIHALLVGIPALGNTCINMYDRIASTERENWNGVRNGVRQGGLGVATSSVLYRYLDLNYNNENASFPHQLG